MVSTRSIGGLAALGRPPAERIDSADQAIAALRAGGFDLVIVDLVREGAAHLTAIEALRGDALLSGMVCVAISADVQSTPTQKAIEIGVDDVLREPLDRSVARLCFSACLERRKLRDDALQYWMATASDETDEHARALLDALPEAVVAVRRDGAIDMANAVAERMFGLSGGALIGTPFSALVSRAVDDGRGAHLVARSAGELCAARRSRSCACPAGSAGRSKSSPIPISGSAAT